MRGIVYKAFEAAGFRHIPVESAILGSDPDGAVIVERERFDSSTTDARCVAGLVKEPCHCSRLGIEAVQSVVECPHSEICVSIEQKLADGVAAERGGVGRIVNVSEEAMRARIEPEYPSTRNSYPEKSITILHESIDVFGNVGR